MGGKGAKLKVSKGVGKTILKMQGNLTEKQFMNACDVLMVEGIMGRLTYQHMALSV